MTQFKPVLALIAATALSACAGGNGAPAPVVFQGSVPPGANGGPGDPTTDPRGIVTYPSYQAVVAREGDSVASIAGRVGLDPQQLADYNGLPPEYRPAPGETIVLPPRRDRYGVDGRQVADTGQTGDGGWSVDVAAAAIERADPGRTGAGTGPVTSEPLGSLPEAAIDPSEPRDGIQPIRHVVGPSETLFSIARLYDISVTSLAAWNGIGADFTVTPGDVIYVPLAEDGTAAELAPVAAPAAPEAAATPEPEPEPVIPVPEGVDVATADPEREPTPVPRPVVDPGSSAAVPPPPSASRPLPEDTAIVVVPESPALSENAAQEDSAIFLKPVDGEVLRAYNPGPGPGQNEGIDFAAEAGASVRAADDGEVVLVSRSVGELDTIVMIRHPNDLVTVYGRLGGVSVARGDRIRRGQPIGTVASRDTPSVQFQIRRGMDHVDPAPYL